MWPWLDLCLSLWPASFPRLHLLTLLLLQRLVLLRLQLRYRA